MSSKEQKKEAPWNSADPDTFGIPDQLTDEQRADMRRRAALNAARIRSEIDRRERSSMAEMREHFEQLAAAATGMSVEELRAAAVQIETQTPGQSVQADPKPTARSLARRRMASAGVPELHVKHVADSDPIECPPLIQVREVLASSDVDLLVLSGEGETYKTGCASWALGTVDDGAFIEAPDLLAVKIEDKARWLKLKTASIVVLDDLGTETADGKDQFITAFNSFFNSAYARCAKLIITTNLTAEQFKSAPTDRGYGERAVRRIRERGRWWVCGKDATARRG